MNQRPAPRIRSPQRGIERRVAPPCIYFGENGSNRGPVPTGNDVPGERGACGGCQYQHLSYDAQLDLKTRIVADLSGERQRRDGERWIDLVAWTRSAAVRQGGSPNDLSVRAVGNRLTFTINGTQVASVEDGAPMAGGAGVFVGGDYNEVALDRFTVEAAD